MPKARVAEWRDRAEAAIEQIETVDLRDLRSVVTKAESAAKDEDSRELAERLRNGLADPPRSRAGRLAGRDRRAAGRRPGRAGPERQLPPAQGRHAAAGRTWPSACAAAAGAALTDQIGAKRWSTVLEALALSPVHSKVEPASIPATPNEELVAAVTKVSMQVPQIAAKFGIEPKAPPRNRGAAVAPAAAAPVVPAPAAAPTAPPARSGRLASRRPRRWTRPPAARPPPPRSRVSRSTSPRRAARSG